LITLQIYSRFHLITTFYFATIAIILTNIHCYSKLHR